MLTPGCSFSYMCQVYRCHNNIVNCSGTLLMESSSVKVYLTQNLVSILWSYWMKHMRGVWIRKFNILCGFLYYYLQRIMFHCFKHYTVKSWLLRVLGLLATFWSDLFLYKILYIHCIYDTSFLRDILLGLMKRLIKMRASSLKVLITSATLDGKKVSEFFSDCPVLNVPGKLYPVEILYSKEHPTSYLESSLKTAIGMIWTPFLFLASHKCYVSVL